MPLTDPLYGRHPRSVLAGYTPIAYARHVRDFIRALHGQGAWYDEILVEEHEDGTVTILPSESIPYPGQDIWRKARRGVPNV